MINLLPPDNKKQIRAGRGNVLLLRYNFLLVGVVVFLGVAIGITYIFLSNARVSAEQTIEQNIAKEGAYSNVKQQAEQFRSKIANAKTVFDSQANYSKAALAIAREIPDGAALQSLTLDQTSFTGPMTLTFDVSGETAAAQLINNFEQSSFFSKVTKGTISQGSSKYPYSIELTVTMSKQVMQ